VVKKNVNIDYADIFFNYDVVEPAKREKKDKENRTKKIRDSLIIITANKLKKSEESTIIQIIQKIESELPETEFVLLINDITNKLPWKIQKIIWKIINYLTFRTPLVKNRFFRIPLPSGQVSFHVLA